MFRGHFAEVPEKYITRTVRFDVICVSQHTIHDFYEEEKKNST